MPQGIAPLTPEELALFNEFLTSKLGLVFPEHKREILASRLEPRLRFHHVHRYIDYYLLLQYDLERELDPLIRSVTNNESYFFREVTQLEALHGGRVAELMAGGVDGKLRILSAGCSAGEEPYSINIHVRGAALGLLAENLRIDAIDIDSERLEMAREAHYRPHSLRALSRGQIDRYFTDVGHDVFELRQSYRRGVHFARGNIVDPESCARALPYDVVYCRNVLIYFSEAGLKTAIDNFARLIRPGGLLFLGHSESIIGLTQAFRVDRLDQCIAYRRAGS